MKTIIRNLPTEAEIREMVDEIIAPETAEREAKQLAKLLLTVADAENDELWHLANIAARHSFTKTDSFRQAFEEFASFPDAVRQNRSEQDLIEVTNENN